MSRFKLAIDEAREAAEAIKDPISKTQALLAIAAEIRAGHYEGLSAE